MRRSPAPRPRLRRDTRAPSAGIPHPARACGRGYSYTSTSSPHPARAFAGGYHTSPAPPPPHAFGRGYSYPSASSPHPARASVEIPVHPLPALPPRPRLRQRIPVHFCRHPHPTRACGAPPPPPGGGGVRAWRYLVGSRIRGGTGRPPCLVLFRLIPGHWTMWISPRGVGPTGRGNLFPLPCLSRLQPSYPSAGRPPILLCRHPHSRGGVRACDTWWAAVSGVEPAGNRIRLFSRISPCCGPCGYRHGGWG